MGHGPPLRIAGQGAYLDFAELQARSRRPMHMADWIAKLDDFLRLSDHDVLTHAGEISHQLAEEHAHAQYALHEEHRRQLETEQSVGDFDETVRRLTEQPLREAKPKRRAKKSKEGRAEEDE